MARLFKAFLFRLRRDLTFRITLFIGIGMAIFMTLLYLGLQFLLDTGDDVHLLTGESMLISSLSPAQNFGIAIPVNLISFTIIEFTHGTIRNKIIAGNSKGKIYASLFLSGLIFSLALIIVYASLCTLLGTIFGGFHTNGTSTVITSFGASLTGQYIWRVVVVAILSYVSITSLSVFMATLVRNIGGTIPIVIILILACYFLGTIMSSIAMFSDSMKTAVTIIKYIDPLYGLSEQYIEINQETGEMKQYMPDDTFISAIINNLAYAALFFVAGLFIFKRRDVK